ncbi:uncharacterized protein LOC112023786 [Quercus suber]|uniref:uncharacterized protein LOC112023786 n=1 Tax=Quercus suber TaxID=58331 RepID=UPI0032E01CDA
MLEDQVASLLQRYLGNYVRGLNKEALKISVWKGNVELTNMQLKPEALNALKLPVKVKAGFLGSVKLKVPWSRLGQDPVLVYLDRIFLLAEPATQVEGQSEDVVQEAKRSRVREMEMKLLEKAQQLKLEMNKSWLGSLISTIIGNLKLSISNIHIRYEDLESNPGHPFAAGVTLEKLSAVTIDDNGKETFVTGGALDRLQKSVELDRLALYWDSDSIPWHLDKPWEDLLPSEWFQVFRFGTKDGKPADFLMKKHNYILQPVSGNAKYIKMRQNEFADSSEQKAVVNLDDMTLCLSKDGYRDVLKLADNFAAFNQRLKYAHYRPNVSVKSDPRSWWKYAYKVVTDQMKKASGKLTWEQVLRYTSLRKRYISLYASLLKSDLNRAVVDDNKDIEELDRELDIELILQWRMLAHKFVEQSVESDLNLKKQKAKKSWWSFGWNGQSDKDEAESFKFGEEDWEQLNKIIGYKEGEEAQSFISTGKMDSLHTFLEVHMKHNASKLLDEALDCLAELSCEDLDCTIKLYPETKIFDVKLGSYKLSSPNGLLTESATAYDSLVGVFCYKPFDRKVDWSMVAKASPCYMTYLKDSIDQIINFFKSSTAVSQTIALETAAAVQMTIDGVKRTAQQQVNRALKDHARFLLDLDIAAPKIMIPTDFLPDNSHPTKLMLDLGNLLIRTQDEGGSPEELNMYLQFDLVLSDVSAFLVDGDYHWPQNPLNGNSVSTKIGGVSFLPVIDKCGIILKLQQIRLERPSYPSTRLAVRLPSLGFHFSPARYHRLMQVVKIFQGKDSEDSDLLRPWNQADFEGWLSLLTWKGVGNREAVWQRRYFCLVGPFLYVLESPDSKSYKQYISLRGKHIYQVPPELVGDAENILALCNAARSSSKVVEDVNALILRCDSDDSRKSWQNRLQGAIYRASGAAPITTLSETSSDPEDSEAEYGDKLDVIDVNMERLFVTGFLDELKVCFSYSYQQEQSFMNVLLAEESRLFEFRAIGGQVELSIIENDMFIGTVLKSLEIEDLVSCNRVSRPCFLARSVIRSAASHSSFYDAGSHSFESNNVTDSNNATSSEGDDNFYEAPENLVDSVDYPMQSPRNESGSEILSLKPPSFDRMAGLLPTDALQTKSQEIELTDTLDSFVKAQIIIYDQNSPRYNNMDNQVKVTLATLSFFCRRKTIVAIMEFVNAINIKDDRLESFSDSSSTAIMKQDVSREDVVDDKYSTLFEEPVVKGLLGKGKSRIMFNLTLHMAHAQILLMNEDETKLASLSQDNLLMDIMVFPSSFSIKAALGNLRISDDSLPSSHMYFWACDMRNPGGSSFVELVFTSYSADDEDYKGYEYSLFGHLSEVRIVYLNRFIQEVVSYFMGLVPNNSKPVVKLKDQVTNSEKLLTASEIEGSPAVKLDLSLTKPIILMPRRTDSLDYLKLDIVHITVQNTFRWFCGHKSEMNAVHLEILTVQVEDINLNVGTGTELGESIIQDVKGVSVVIQRSLRDLLHQVPSTEVAIKIEELKAALSSGEYQIITECALSNISETPRVVPPLKHDSPTYSVDAVETIVPQDTTGVVSETVETIVPQDAAGVVSEAANGEAWIVIKVSVVINLVELSLYAGSARGASLAIVQISDAWLLYKSNTLGEGFLSATLKGFTVIDDREGTEQEFKLAIGKPENIGPSPLDTVTYDENQHVLDANEFRENGIKPLSLKKKNGRYLDSCIFLGANSSYSASKDDQVYLDEENEVPHTSSSRESINDVPSQDMMADRSTEFIIELQAIGPELTFYNTSKDVGDSQILSNQLLHAQLDAFCRLVLKGDTIEMSANALGLTMESSGIRILEPFDTSVKYSNASGKTNIHLFVSDIFMNFSFSILRLFLAVEEDILAFLRMTSKKMTVICSQFDKIGTIKNPNSDQIFAFWRPHAPPGFAVLGDCLTPLDKPPTKGVLAVNTNFARVKRPISFKLIWAPLSSGDLSGHVVNSFDSLPNVVRGNGDTGCSIWFPVAPEGYVALGCVVSPGITQPPLSSAFCILASLVCPCSLRDCIAISTTDTYLSSLSFWRIDNSLGTFLPADPANFSLKPKAYDLRHMIFGLSEDFAKAPTSTDAQTSPSGHLHNQQSGRSIAASSGRRFEAVASFRLIWWNQGSYSRKKLSIWRPVVPQGMLYFGDIAVKGYEPPNNCIVLHDSGDEELFKAPLSFQLVGQIKKQRGMDNISFWLPQPPPGYVSLGCIASKGPPKQNEFSTLRCMRSDMVTGDQFLEESIWDTSDAKFTSEPFSIWVVDNELGTFIVRSGFKRPPKRFALRLADSSVPSGSDDTVIDAEIATFSAALFDDYSGLMVPLFNISFSGIGFSLHGRTDCLSSTVNFSLAAQSYNDKYEAWEPLVEPVDGLLRYQYNINAPGAASQLRLTSTRDLNINVSVSNANMIIQAYASWINLSHVHEYHKKQEAFSPTYGGRSIIDIHHQRNYYIIPQNKLGQDIFIRATDIRGLPNIIRMPSGDMKSIKVPVSKDMLDSHLKGKLGRKFRTMVTVVIVDAQFPRVKGLTSHQYTVAIRLTPDQSVLTELQLHQQSARTSGRSEDKFLSTELELVNWNEVFFFKVDSPDYYLMELIVTDMGKGDPIGYFSAPLKQIVENIQNSSYSHDYQSKLTWIELSSIESVNMIQSDKNRSSCGRIRCAVVMSPRPEVESRNQPVCAKRKSGHIQISPSKEGPWTTVRLNYAAPAACWRLGNDVVASEVSVKDGNRYVNIRSLVSVHNNTDFILDLCLVSKASTENVRPQDGASNSKGLQIDGRNVKTDEFFETEKCDPTIGWVDSSVQSSPDVSKGGSPHKEIYEVELPMGWEWIDDWHLDKASTNDADGWVYGPDVQRLKWPNSFDPSKLGNHARQRRWIRSRKQIIRELKDISVGLLKPGDTVPLPLSGLSQSGMYVLQLRPYSSIDPSEYTWSSVVDRPGQKDSGKPNVCSELCVSTLIESEELLYCTRISGTSSSGSHKLWFCLSIQSTEIAKDINCDPIQDWTLAVKSPLSITNFLPLTAEYSVLEMQPSGHFVDCSRGIFGPGKTEKVYSADIRNPLFFSLLPQRGWLPMHEAVPLSDPHQIPSKTLSLRSSISGRIVQVILEKNYDQEQPLLAKIVRVYAPYWFEVARCPPLTFRLLDLSGKKDTRIGLHFLSKKRNEVLLEEITEEEIIEGCTLAPALNFNMLGLAVSISQSGQEHFGPVEDLSPLGDMDGSLNLYAYDADGNCIQLFISTKPCAYQSVPTKVISVRPFMTFTNRLGEDILIKFCSEDAPKVLRASDSRISFVHHETGGLDKLQVRLEDTNWSFPVQIVKEDTIFLVLRGPNGDRRFLRTEIRGYEEGSRFIVVFRLGSANGPIRIENRSRGKTISIRQSGFGEDSWIQLQPLSTTNFSWEDPYGQKFIDAKVAGNDSNNVWKLNLERNGLISSEEQELGLRFLVVEMDDITVARFMDGRTPGSSSHEEITSPTLTGIHGNSQIQSMVQNNAAPVELIIELGVVGVSVVDQRPKEVSYLYLELPNKRVRLLYGPPMDGSDVNGPDIDGVKEGGLVVHGPVGPLMGDILAHSHKGPNRVLALVGLRKSYIFSKDLPYKEEIYSSRLGFYKESPIRKRLLHQERDERFGGGSPFFFSLIDVSELRLKLSLETAPVQRPKGVLGVWSPILSAVGNAFKIQVHLRRVMQRDRFMRKSSIVPAIGNRIWRDLIHNPLHLIFSIDVLGMTSSTLASLSKGFAELSTDGQFLQLRSKQVWSRRITGVGDGIIQGTEALAQGVAFGVSGVVTKPVESARENGVLGLARGLGHAFLGFVVQPVSGALDFFSLTVEGIGASCSKCLEVFSSKTTYERIRNPRAIHADGVLREYCEREATGQMILFLAEASRHFGCTEIFKEPSKFAWSDYYEEHFFVPYNRIVLVTNKRVILLQCLARDKLDKKPCKIMWDIPWEELMAVELAKAGCNQPSHLILHLKNFRRSENFVRVIKCGVEELEGREPQAVRICSVVHKMWKAYEFDRKILILNVPSSQRHVYFAWSEADGREPQTPNKSILKLRGLSSNSSASDERRFVKHSVNFLKIWSSEQESKERCTLCKKQVMQDGGLCSIWRPVCPDGYVSIGDIARVGSHPPNVAAVYRNIDRLFALPVGFDLVWRNCLDDYTTPVSIWHPRAPEGYVSPGCIAVANFTLPEPDSVYCVAESLSEETVFEEQKVWSAPDSYPWACHIYQVQSDALHFVSLRQKKEESDWKPMRVVDDPQPLLQSSVAQ